MIRFICEKCGHIWYTANTRPNQKCSDCGGVLQESEMISAKEVEKNEKNAESKVIYLNIN